jgi:uncharacterized protein (DUF433 family)
MLAAGWDGWLAGQSRCAIAAHRTAPGHGSRTQTRCITLCDTVARGTGEPESKQSGTSGVQRSFRLAAETLQLLSERAVETSETRNALAERLIAEGVRIDRHPLIAFRRGASGLRRPALAGTRLDVWQVIDTVRGEQGDVAAAAAYLGIPERLVRAAVDYYAEFAEEIDDYRAEELRFAERERERWERAQRVLG